MSGKKVTVHGNQPVTRNTASVVKDQVKFEPKLYHRLAKSRLQAALEDASAVFSEENLTTEQLCRLAGTQRMKQWVKDPVVMNWMLDRDDFAHRAVAYAETVIDELYAIAMCPLNPDDRTVTAKDKINAADKLLQLADRYPNKRKEITFLDKDIAKLEDHEVDDALAKYQKLLVDTEGEA